MRILSVGDHALLVEVADDRQAQAAYARIRAVEPGAGLAPPGDVVPAARTVLLDGCADVMGWRRFLEEELTSDRVQQPVVVTGDEVTIAVRYDGADLEVVAAAWRCDVDEVVQRHQATTFTVSFCGFAPGFAYCTSHPELPEVPRRDDPRTRVPAGSVALAGPYCGVYPREMPGGWQLVGTTSATVFDAGRDRPALLSPGDRVRFEAQP